MTHRFAVAVVAGLSLLLAAGSLRAELPSIDQQLPPNVLLLIRIASCTGYHEAFAQSSFGRLINDPAMAEVREYVMKKFHEASHEAENEIGMPLSDVLTIPQGEAALAVVQAGAKIGIVLTLDVGDGQERLDKLIEKAEAKLQEEGELTHSMESFEGTEISVWTNENAGPRAPINAICHCIRDGRLVIATSAQLAKDVLTRWDGAHDKTFAADPTWKYIQDRCSFGDLEPLMSWYVNPIGALKAGIAAAGPQASGAGIVIGFLPVLGLSNLKAIGGSAALGGDEYEGQSKTLIYVQQPITGVLKAFVCPPADQTPPPFIGAGTTNLNGVHWDVQGAYEAVGETWDMFTSPGTFAKIMDDAERAPNGPRLHPKADIIDRLKGQMFMIQEFPEDGGLEQQRLAMLFAVDDDRRTEDVMTKIANLDGANMAVREFQGHKIFEPEQVNGPMSPALAVANGFLIFSINVEMLEGLLRGDSDEPLAKNAGYLRATKEFPGPVSMFTYQRQDAFMGAMYAAMKKGLAENADGDFDPDILPEWDTIRKYFGVVASYSVPDDNGVFMVSFGLKPE